MKVKVLVKDQYVILVTMKGNSCPIEESSLARDYKRDFEGLLDMLQRAAQSGFHQFSSAQSHEINKNPKILEFIRGRLRLIYFHGQGKDIVVCTELFLKKTKKVPRALVEKAIKVNNAYLKSCQENTLEVMDEEDN